MNRLAKNIYLAGKVLFPLGIIMFFLGAIGFSYNGSLHPILNKIMYYSFIAWLPVLLFGIVFISFKKVAR